MTALAFLGFALVCSVLGSLYLWSRTHKPTSMEAGMEEFSRGLAALAPGRQQPDTDTPAMPRHPNVVWSPAHPSRALDDDRHDDGADPSSRRSSRES